MHSLALRVRRNSRVQVLAAGGHTEAVTRMVAGYDANSGSGVWTEQQWNASGGKGTVTDDSGRKALRLEKQPGKLTSWKMFRTVAVEEAKNLLSKGGEIAVRFKIPDGSELVNGQFVFGLYWPVSQWASGAAANSMLASFFLQTDASNLNLMHHKGSRMRNWVHLGHLTITGIQLFSALREITAKKWCR